MKKTGMRYRQGFDACKFNSGLQPSSPDIIQDQDMRLDVVGGSSSPKLRAVVGTIVPPDLLMVTADDVSPAPSLEEFRTKLLPAPVKAPSYALPPPESILQLHIENKPAQGRKRATPPPPMRVITGSAAVTGAAKASSAEAFVRAVAAADRAMRDEPGWYVPPPSKRRARFPRAPPTMKTPVQQNAGGEGAPKKKQVVRKPVKTSKPKPTYCKKRNPAAGGWTDEENETLIKHMGHLRAPWGKDTWTAELAKKLPGRSQTSVRSHWYEHLRIGPSQSLQYLSGATSEIVSVPCPLCAPGSGKAKGHSGTHRTTIKGGKTQYAKAKKKKREWV